MRLLVVEDEPKMARLLARGLREEGHVVDLVADGPGALATAATRPYDVIVLDIMIPGLSGFDVCARLRRRQVWTPVLMLTARGEVGDRVRGLDAGADDYLVKPFSLTELFARLRALARRGPSPRPVVLQVGGLRLDPATRQVWRNEQEIDLTAKEFALLETFMRRPGVVLTREQLLDRCWGFSYEGTSNVVDVYVRYLREKIDRPFALGSVETVRGTGYRLRRDGGPQAPRGHGADESGRSGGS